jgi:hypothetical protein
MRETARDSRSGQMVSVNSFGIACAFIGALYVNIVEQPARPSNRHGFTMLLVVAIISAVCG